MPNKDYYKICREGIGRGVEIQTHDGHRYHGIIDRVDNHHVYLKEIPQSAPGSDGTNGSNFVFSPFGPFFFTPFVPFASIYALTFLPFFW